MALGDRTAHEAVHQTTEQRESMPLDVARDNATPNRPHPERNGTGGVPPVPPMGAISMLSWQRVTSAYGHGVGESETAQRTAVATALREADGAEPGGESSATGTSAASMATIPPLPRAKPTAKPTAAATAEPSAAPPAGAKAKAAKKPIIIAGAKPGKKTARMPIAPGEARDAAGFLGWPRSKAGRVVALVAVAATLLTALAVASPLGAGPGIGVAFQAYGNAMPWHAPAAPTSPSAPANPPVTTSSNPGKQAIIDDIQTVFGQYSPGALNIARCESGYDPTARNTIAVAGSHAEGVFQILYPGTWNGTSYRSYSPYNSWANIRAAYEIFKRDGYSWREWACHP